MLITNLKKHRNWTNEKVLGIVVKKRYYTRLKFKDFEEIL